MLIDEYVFEHIWQYVETDQLLIRSDDDDVCV